MIKFQQVFCRLLREDVEIPSPYPRLYKLEKTDKGLYKRTYTDGRLRYSKDKQGAILHNLDGPAITETSASGSVITVGYYIEGEHMSKKDWENRKLVSGVKSRVAADTIIDLFDV